MRLADGQQPSPESLQNFVRDHLAPHKTPKIWVAVESYPLTASGKIQKYRLAEMFSAGELTENMSPG